MNQTEIRMFAGLSIVIGAGIWLGLFLYNSFDVISFDSLRSLNAGITVVGLFWFGYFKWAWKWPYVRRLLYRPDVNGTWLGEFESDWKNDQGEENPPRKFVLVVRQFWFSISVRAYTKSLKTESYVETLIIDESKGVKLLAYLFSEKRVGTGDHGSRQGAAELDLTEDGARRLLAGHFWTQAGTRGYLKVKLASHSELVDSFDQATGTWQEQEFWETLDAKQG